MRAAVTLTWCERCGFNHDGLCLDESRRLDFREALDDLFEGRRQGICPYCGVEGPICPVARHRLTSPRVACHLVH